MDRFEPRTLDRKTTLMHLPFRRSGGQLSNLAFDWARLQIATREIRRTDALIIIFHRKKLEAQGFE